MLKAFHLGERLLLNSAHFPAFGFKFTYRAQVHTTTSSAIRGVNDSTGACQS